MTPLNVSVFPAEPNFKFIYKDKAGKIDVGFSVFAWRVSTWPTADADNPLETRIEPINALGKTPDQYLGVQSPRGHMMFSDGREYQDWDDFKAENPDS